LITSLTQARKEPPAAYASGLVASRGYKEWSLYGAPRLQPMAISGKSERL